MVCDMLSTPRPLDLAIYEPYSSSHSVTLVGQLKFNSSAKVADIAQDVQNWRVFPYFLMIMFFSWLEFVLISFC